ncbi:MAG: cupredoxin domain-containing protein [Candidatus Daviesbacteria bacterium]|nr:cupredoxin domain-containing protein [Candidatus Daviesbacteria bacterium]
MSKNALVTIAVVGVIAIVGIWFLKGSSKTAPQPAYQQTPQVAIEAVKNIVTITTSGFIPQSITVKAGETVTWINQDSANHAVNSVVHPTHLVYTPLNLGNLKPGEEKPLSFPEAGTYKYHDHLNPSSTGSVVVE